VSEIPGMMSRRTATIIGAIVAAVVILGVFAFCRHEPTPLPPAEQTSLDSLAASKPDYQAKRDTLVLRETTFVRQSREDRVRATRAEHAADSLRDLANRWQAAAIAQGDTVTAWYAIATVERHEGDSLRAANIALHRAATADSVARSAADARAESAERRLVASDDLNQRLARDLRQASPPCRILWTLGCPSRKTSFVVGVVVASAGAYVVTHRSQFSGVLP